MKTRDEIVDAIEKRIVQIKDGANVLIKYQKTQASAMRMLAVKEELETLLKWIRD